MPGVEELSVIDFNNIIANPLKAVVSAQRESSETTLAFLRSDTVRDADGNVRNVSFKYKKHFEVAGQVMAQDCQLEVPILTMIPIPFLRIADVNIKFRAKITTTHNTPEDAEQPVKVQGHYAHTRKTFTGDTNQSEYTLNIKVRAVQDALPAGMERVLTLLENCIKETALKPAEPAKKLPQNGGGKP